MRMLRSIGRLFRGKEPAAAVVLPPELQRIISPNARDRWLSPLASSYTPASIEATVRSAFSGDLVGVWELYDLMEATWPRLAKNLAELKDAVASMEMSVEAWAPKGKQPSPEAVRRAALLEDALWSMRPRAAADEDGRRQMLKNLLDAWGKGIAVLEVDWSLRTNVTAGQAYVAPRCTRWVHPRFYGYPSAGYDRIGDELMLNARQVQSESVGEGRVQIQLDGSLHGWIPFPADKFLIAISKQKSGHPVGGALLRPLAWWWCASNFSAEWWLNFAQIFGVPIRWATYDPNVPGLLERVSDMLAGMGSSLWAAMPGGTNLELKEPTTRGADAPQVGIIDRADKYCDLLVLGQTLTSDVGDSGSRALGDVHAGVLGDRKLTAAEWVSEVLNGQLVPAFCRLNFGDEAECPWIQLADEEVKDAKAMIERDQVALDMGCTLPEAWFRSRHDIPRPEGGEAVLQRQAPTQPVVPGASPGQAAATQEDEDSVQAKAAGEEAEVTIDQIVLQAVAENVGARKRWLRPLVVEIQRLARLAENQQLSDAEVGRLIETGRQRLPELFGELDQAEFTQSLTRAAGAAALAGLKARVP